jgi:hypothetical protein
MQIARFMPPSRTGASSGGRVSCSASAPDRVVWSDQGQSQAMRALAVVWAFLRQSLCGRETTMNGRAARASPVSTSPARTGTAQMIAKSKAEKGQDHAWFAAFAPAKAPEVVVVCSSSAAVRAARSPRRSPARS